MVNVARTSKTYSLCVWMNEIRVGRWSVNAQGSHEFSYEASWLEEPETRPISLSLPLAPSDFTYSGKVVEAYFDNLLPDSTEIRQRIRSRYGAASLSAFDLLAEVGRDCVGALQLLPDEEPPKGIWSIEGRDVDETQIETILKGVTSLEAGTKIADESFRISIAGAQEKTALLYHEGRWMVPLGSTPTTHILKLPLGTIGGMGIDMSGSIENEWLCSRIAEALGISTAKCEIGRFGDTSVLIVERFDRRLAQDGSWIMRLPQEDFCQVTGTPPSGKYESDGGPGILPIMRLLLGSREPFIDREAFFKAQLLFWLLAAPDGHAKNFSVFIEQGGRFRLTPLYDIISAYPVLGHGKGRIPPQKLKLAMAFSGKNRHYEWDKIGLRHIRETAKNCDFAQEIDKMVAELVARVPLVVSDLSATLPATFPDAIASPIFEGLLGAAKRLEV
ncbi:MAG: type II toxin-antitoxin system HipA family toxin [Spirochaetaceae bacterium]|nr:type II toxin-antitoxin system HipA family toxin [Spirochaetaceae bacterium]